VGPELSAGPLGPSYRLGSNTTLLSPEFDVPPGVQIALVRVRGRVPVVVRARIADGTERELAVLTPGGPAGRDIPLPGLEGQRVRLVFDPLPALGQSVEVGAVGRLGARVPGWRLLEGVPQVRRLGGRPALRMSGEAIVMESEPFAVAAGGVLLRVDVRGAGVLRVEAGRFRRAVRATDRWRSVTLRVDPARRADLTVRLRALPGEGVLLVRDLGAVMRPVGLRGVRVTRRAGLSLVRGRLTPGAAGVRVRLLVGRASVGSARADRAGRWTIRTRRSGIARLVVDDPERFHPGRRIRL
jgi:hypothetical protein